MKPITEPITVRFSGDDLINIKREVSRLRKKEMLDITKSQVLKMIVREHFKRKSIKK